MRKPPALFLRTYLLIAAAILLLPLLLVSILAAAYHSSSQRKEVEHSAEDAARVVAAAFDAETEVYRTAFRALAAFPDIAGLAPTQLQERMQAFLSKRQPDFILSFSPVSADGSNFGSATKQGGPKLYRRKDSIHSILNVISSGEATLRLVAGPFNRNGDLVMLRMQIVLRRFSRRLMDLVARGNYAISIYDRVGHLVSSSGVKNILPKEAVGRILATKADGGRIAAVGTDGVDYVAFWHDMPDSEQHLVVSLERNFQSIFFPGLFVILLAASVLPLLGGLVSATFLARILYSAQGQVLAAAAAVGYGRRIAPLQTPLREANVVGQTLVEASVQLENGAKALLDANERLERHIQERTRELHQKSQLIEDTLNSLDQGIIHFDEHGKILLANRHAEEMFAEPWARDMSPDSWMKITFTGAPVHGAWDTDNPSNVPRNGGVPFVVEHRLPDGRDMEIRRTALADGSTVCLLSDVSHRVQLADELQLARMRAEDANKAKDDFLANMSHELRTPLTAVLGYADLLMLDPSLSEVNQERIRRLRGAGHGLLTLLNDVLDYARITAGEFSIDHTSFEIIEVVHDALSVVQPLALEKKLVLEVDLDDALPRRLMGDPNRTRQILINLLNNAVKFTDFGFIRLGVRTRAPDDAGAVVLHFCVEDSGVGIPFDQQELVFERFHQVDRSNDAIYRGAGLGLSICRKLIELMGGKIWLRSFPEIGTTVMVSLAFSSDSREVGPAPQFRRMRHARILLADDVELGRDVTAQLLQAFCVKVDCVSNGFEATDAVTKHFYDLVILDLNMPKMDGHEAARIIRQNPLTRHIPIIACSASPPAAESSSNERYYDGFLCKPLDAPTLQAMLDRHIAATGMGRFSANLRPSQSSPKRERKSLENLVGTARVRSGLDELERYLAELLSLDLKAEQNAVRVIDASHAAVTSARLMGFDELFHYLLRLDDHTLGAEQLLSLAAGSRPTLIRLRDEVADCRRNWPM